MAGLFDERTGGLIAYWKSLSAITDLVGSGTACRIWPEMQKQGATLPHVVFTRTGGEAEQHLAGVSGTRTTIVNVFCYGSTSASADAVAEAIRTNTANYRGDMSGVYVNWVECSDSPDSGVDEAKDSSDTHRYWVRVILRITHAEAVGV